jgi:hypothetical protein
MITYRSTTVQPAWIITLIVIDVVLLILLATVLCGALLGKWRALLVSIISLGWPLPGAYLLNPAIFTSSGAPTSADWAGLLLYAVLPLSAFVVGWIYERRRRAQFGVSFLSMSIGIALLIIPPIIISSILNSAGAYSGSSFAADLLASWCLVVLVIFPLALLVAGLEALLHTIVSKTMRGARAGEANTPASMG